jgi:tetrahydromethanopterin S-methyltransferase subunit B
MNTIDEQMLKSLQELNGKIKEFNTLLENLIRAIKADKLKALQDLNGKIKEFNTLLVDLIESLKKDALESELHHSVSSSA